MRTIIAAVLTAAALIALLVGWFGAGWRGVASEERAVRAAPRAQAEATARALAADLSARLDELRRHENERPYYHYGNLFHDPRGSMGLSVAPSPLASGPSDALVRGHFQIDARGAVSVPTINDQVPELSAPGRADVDRALRTQIAALEPSLIVLPARGDGAGPLVAMADAQAQGDDAEYVWIDDPDPAPVGKPPVMTKRKAPGKKAAVEQAQVVQFSKSAYAQNAAPEEIYQQVNARPSSSDNAPQAATDDADHASAPDASAAAVLDALQRAANAEEKAANANANDAPPIPAPRPAHHRRRVRVPKPVTPPAAAPSVQVTIAPFEWRTTAIDGEPALAAVRRVDTPDGDLTQGFVVVASAADAWLGDRAQSAGAHVTAHAPAGDAIVAAPVGVPGWYVTVDAGAAIAAADVDAAAIQRAFLGRFVPIALLALACGAMVVLVVARAEKLARERARFAAAAAHELRTPLAGLQLYGDMLADGLGDPGKARDYARRMAEEASRLGRVVSNVLGFSQLERGNLSVHPAMGDVAEAVRASCERARPALERAGVTLELDVPDAPLRARFDGDALARVIGNLLDNAEKYGREAADRGVVVRAARAGDRVEITVADHGPGVPDGAVARLFRPFVRGGGADAPPGLGLGLALSRSLAQAMAGDLLHRETAGGGATFVLQLATA